MERTDIVLGVLEAAEQFIGRKLCEALTPMLAPAGVECVYEPEIPALQAIVADLVAFLHRDSPLHAKEERKTRAAGKDKIPAPNDLKGWKQADHQLYQRLMQDFGADERISPPEPVELSPEMAASIQEKLTEHYMGWLDEPLPILGGKTPRQACRTEAGRQQVSMLIRTMPDPMGSAPIRAPREAMLRELGLFTETPASEADQHLPHAHIPMGEIPAKSKVPRNAPCPCGSGRKYKKCCGRES